MVVRQTCSLTFLRFSLLLIHGLLLVSHISCQPAKCKLPKSVGSCGTYSFQYAFDGESGACIRFVYSGCGGNDNRFDSEAECLTACQSGSSSRKPGSCPTPNGVGNCVQQCDGDDACQGIQKCCSNGCGTTCIDPSESQSLYCPDFLSAFVNSAGKTAECSDNPANNACPTGYSCLSGSQSNGRRYCCSSKSEPTDNDGPRCPNGLKAFVQDGTNVKRQCKQSSECNSGYTCTQSENVVNVRLCCATAGGGGGLQMQLCPNPNSRPLINTSTKLPQLCDSTTLTGGCPLPYTCQMAPTGEIRHVCCTPTDNGGPQPSIQTCPNGGSPLVDKNRYVECRNPGVAIGAVDDCPFQPFMECQQVPGYPASPICCRRPGTRENTIPSYVRCPDGSPVTFSRNQCRSDADCAGGLVRACLSLDGGKYRGCCLISRQNECPDNREPYFVNQNVATCNPISGGNRDCVAGFTCERSGGRNICCKERLSCPVGRTPEPTSQISRTSEPKTCNPSNPFEAACRTGYECVFSSSTFTNYSPTTTTGYICCSKLSPPQPPGPSYRCPIGTRPPQPSLPPPACSPGAFNSNSCPIGYNCVQTDLTAPNAGRSLTYGCCKPSSAVPIGQCSIMNSMPYMVNSVPLRCNSPSDTRTCPSGFSCQRNVAPTPFVDAYICCSGENGGGKNNGVTTCPNQRRLYVVFGSPQYCAPSIANSCQPGYECVQSGSDPSISVCCSTVNPSITCASSTAKPLLSNGGSPQYCTLNSLSSCPPGYSCQQAVSSPTRVPITNSRICCSSSTPLNQVMQCPFGKTASMVNNAPQLCRRNQFPFTCLNGYACDRSLVSPAAGATLSAMDGICCTPTTQFNTNECYAGGSPELIIGTLQTKRCNSANQCGSGSQCVGTKTNGIVSTTEGSCCRGFVYQCPFGTRSFNPMQICNPQNGPASCPVGYTCSGPANGAGQMQCCSAPAKDPNSGSCPNNQQSQGTCGPARSCSNLHTCIRGQCCPSCRYMVTKMRDAGSPSQSVPSCDSTGIYFMAKQCNGNNCFCVKPYGDKIPNSDWNQFGGFQRDERYCQQMRLAP